LEGVISNARLQRPGGEFVVEDLDQLMGVDFKRRLFGVHCLMIVFFFEVILFSSSTEDQRAPELMVLVCFIYLS
jgi:hypothetical protein